MSYAPPTIRELETFWRSQGGVSLGIVGDAAHQMRPSYHNGQDALHGRTAATDYSIRNVRDREPYLTNAAAALDLGKLDGSYVELRRFSSWLVDRCKAKAPGTNDIREVIWSPDGKVVRRWDGYLRQVYDGYPTNSGQGDASHLTHTHISFPRDSETRRKVALFAPYFATPPDTGTEEGMGLRLQLDATNTDSSAWSSFYKATVKGAGHAAINVATKAYVSVADGLALGVVQSGSLLAPLEAQVGRPPIAGDRTSVVCFDMSVAGAPAEAYVCLRSDVVLAPWKPPATDCTPAANAAYNSGLEAAASAVAKVPRR